MRVLFYRYFVFCLAIILAGCVPPSGEAERNFFRGNRFLSEGLPQMAVQSYRRSLAEDPDQPDVWFNLGVAHQRIDQWEQAAQAFRQSLSLRPSAEAWYNLGYAELRRDRPAEAAEALSRSVVIKANQPAAWNNLGISNRRLRRYRLAEEAFRKALSLDPEDPEILNNLAWLYLVWDDAGAERRKKAIQLAKQADGKTGGRNARILATLAEAHFRNENRKSAVEAIRRALLLEPKNSLFLERLAKYEGRKTSK
ncbi:MAG: tetratricopeptide repeat protein [Nitrospinota bacterium]